MSEPKKRKSAWPTLWAILPVEESDRALNAAGTIGFAIYAALHILRFKTPRAHQSAFYCSGQNISKHSGVSLRRVWEPIRQLETAGLVKVERPKGQARFEHAASKISLLPIFTRGNKVGERPLGDNAASPEVTVRHTRDCQEAPSNLAVIEESPLQGDSYSDLAGRAGSAPSVADESRGAGKAKLTQLAVIACKDQPSIRYKDLVVGIVSAERVSKPTAKLRVRAMLRLGVMEKTPSGLYVLPGTSHQPATVKPTATPAVVPTQQQRPIVTAAPITHQPAPAPTRETDQERAARLASVAAERAAKERHFRELEALTKQIEAKQQPERASDAA